jgi:hypothetical protein
MAGCDCRIRRPVNAQAVVLPASADDIWELDSLPRLEHIQVPYANTLYMSIGGILFSKDGKRLLLYPAGRVEEEYVPPEGTKHIYSPLYIAPALKSLILPSTVTDLPDSSDMSGLLALHAFPGN